MTYKKCDFRDRAKVCNFREDDCNPDACDFYEIKFEGKAIKKKIKELRKEVINLHERLKEMKKNHEHKENKEVYKKVKKERNDKAIGIMKLSKSYATIKNIKVKDVK